MSFYIAERNKNTCKFELWMKDSNAHELGESEAINYYEMILRQQGQKNVILLEEVIMDVDLKVSRYVLGDAE